MNVKNLKKKQKGLTLIETLIALLVLGVVIAGALLLYSRANASSAANATQNQLLALTTAVREISPGPSFTGITQSTLVTARKAPSDMVNGTNLVNKFGGPVTIAAATYGTGAPAGNAFTISFAGVPADVCSSVVARALENYPRIEVGSTVVQDKRAATPVVGTATSVTTACGAADEATLTFTAAG